MEWYDWFVRHSTGELTLNTYCVLHANTTKTMQMKNGKKVKGNISSRLCNPRMSIFVMFDWGHIRKNIETLRVPSGNFHPAFSTHVGRHVRIKNFRYI